MTDLIGRYIRPHPGQTVVVRLAGHPVEAIYWKRLYSGRHVVIIDGDTSHAEAYPAVVDSVQAAGGPDKRLPWWAR